MPGEAIELLLDLGWGNPQDYNLKTMQIAINNTHFMVSAKNNENELVGFARVFSDDVFATHIPDLVVRKEYQEKGIGRRMMNVIINKYGHTGIYVDAFKSGGKFYEKLGFKKRPHMEIYSRKFA